MLNKFQLPPLSNEDIFEQFVCDLYNLEFPESSFQRFGKKGNNQNGIDIISTKRRIAIQCKKKEIQRNNKGVLSELKAEFEECVQASLVFNNEIDELFFTSTYNDSTELIKHLIGLKKKYNHSFNLVYIGWQTIEEKAQRHFSLLTKYYPSLFNSLNIRMRIPFFDMGLLEGRSELLKQIEEFYNKHSAFVLYGVGGVGKSAALASYINIKKNHAHYNNIVWIEPQLDSLRNEIMVRLSTSFFTNQDTTDNISWDTLLQKLSDSRGRNLFVIDGIETLDQILLTTIDDICSTGWQVIITSRAKIPDFPFIHIESLSLDSAKLIFNRYCSKEDDEGSIEKILLKLECHPLLVELLAKAVEANSKLTLRNALELLKDEAIHDSALQQLIHIGRHSKKYSSEYEHRIFKYLLFCFTPYALSPIERKQLVFFMVLPHSTSISYDFYLSITGQKHSDILIQTLASLDKKGYISYRKGEYHIHTIVQLVVREKLKLKASKVKTIALNCTRALKDVLEKPSYQLTAYSAIARNILNLGAIEIGTLYLAQFYAAAMVRMGEYVRAIKYYEDCLGFLEKSKISDIGLYSDFLNNLGSAYGYVGEYDKAIGCLWSALQLKDDLDEEGEMSLAITLDNFATVLEKIGRYEEAQKFTLEAIDIFEKYNLEPKLAIAYGNLANSCAFTMQLKKAFSYWKKGYKLLKRHFQPDSIRFADSYNAIGMTHLRSHHPMQAKKYFYKSLIIYKQENNAHILAIGYSNIALCEILLGQLEEAKSHLDKSINLQRSIINGGEHNIASILLNMGEYYIAAENYEMALKVLKEAVEIYDRCFDSHPEAERAKTMIRYLESAKALHFCQQINSKQYMYTLWEVLETNLNIQRKIIDDHGKILYLRGNNRKNIPHDYIFFSFTKCTKTIKAVLTLIKKGYPEDAMALLYGVYRNYLTIEFIAQNPEMSQALILFGTYERFVNEDGTVDALSYMDPKTKKQKDIYPKLYKLIANIHNGDNAIVHTYLEPHLSDHAYSNFITAGSYRTKNQKRYEYKSKEMILQATYLCTYLQFVILDGTLRFLESKGVEVSSYKKNFTEEIAIFCKGFNQLTFDIPKVKEAMENRLMAI